jgi:hypothetical protein
MRSDEYGSNCIRGHGRRAKDIGKGRRAKGEGEKGKGKELTVRYEDGSLGAVAGSARDFV